MTPTFVSPLLTNPIRYGVGTIDIAQMEKKVGQTLAALWNDHNPDYECLHCVDDAIDILDTIKKNVNLLHFDRLIVLGMGASINNPRAVLGESNIHDIMMRKVVFVDNLDENAIMNSTKGCDPVKCGFLVISKSGTTLETTALALAARKWILNHDLPVEDHMLMMTGPNDSPLRRLAQYDGLKHTFTHPPMGGRFAVFTVVTLVPGLFAGLDMRRFLEGASVCLKEAKDKGAQSSVGQAVQFHIHSQNVGRHLHVLEAYDGRLSSLAQWWCQMWAESLGKNSEAVTPIHSSGPFDHHSQWQLYLSALQNKCFTLMMSSKGDEGDPFIDEAIAKDIGLPHFTECRLHDILEATLYGAKTALDQQNVPYALWRFHDDHIHSLVYTVGYLMMHTILAIIIVGRMTGVNPFGQPSVEALKSGARAYMQSKNEIKHK